MTHTKFKLREMLRSDSSALDRLISEFDGDMSTHFLVDAYAAIICGTEYRTRGVVVETEGFDGLVGMGTIRFSEAQFNDKVLPLAFLDGLKVHKDFRGKGLGYRIADWRIQQALEAFGEECVIATGMLQDNHASRAVAKKWCREFIDSASEVLITPTLTRQPKPLSGITVREIKPEEHDEFASRQNAYYKSYNLYRPTLTNRIADSLAVSAGGQSPYHYFVAVDADQNLLAGAQLWVRGMLKSDKINNPPLPLRLLNKAAHLLPPNFTIRDISVNGLWYQSGQKRAAKYFWEMMRWMCKDLGTTMVITFDPRDPSREIITIKPWHQPRPIITMAIKGPGPINRQKLLLNLGRV